jgi:methyl-accepting chemotaxis protein
LPLGGRLLSQRSGLHLRAQKRTEPKPAVRLREVISMPKLDNETILLAFAVVTGLAMLFQTIFLLAIVVAVRKAAKTLQIEAESLRSTVTPVLFETRELIVNTQGVLAGAQDLIANAQVFVRRVTPKIEDAAGDLAEITKGLRAQSIEVQSSVLELLDRVQRQSDRLDDMFTSLLNTVDRAGNFVTDMVSKPVRQLSSIMAMVKAVVDSLRSPLVRR